MLLKKLVVFLTNNKQKTKNKKIKYPRIYYTKYYTKFYENRILKMGHDYKLIVQVFDEESKQWFELSGQYFPIVDFDTFLTNRNIEDTLFYKFLEFCIVPKRLKISMNINQQNYGVFDELESDYDEDDYNMYIAYVYNLKDLKDMYNNWDQLYNDFKLTYIQNNKYINGIVADTNRLIALKGLLCMIVHYNSIYNNNVRLVIIDLDS